MGKLKDKIKKELDRDVKRVKAEVYQDVRYVKTHIPKVITSFIVVLFFIILLVLFKTKQGDKFNQSSTDEMLALANTKEYIIKPTKVKDILNANLEDYKAIDLRSSQERKIYLIDKTIHIPFERILENEHKKLWNDNHKKILISKNEIESTQAWLILSELGYKNILVLEGGVDFWKEDMKSSFGFKSDRSRDDEKPNYDFAEIMKNLKGNENSNNTSSSKQKPRKKIKRTKKKAGGGCG